MPDESVKIIGVEAGGTGEPGCMHSAAINLGRPGVLHGEYTMLLQDDDGQILPSGSISAGLDYPGVGPGTRPSCGRGTREVRRGLRSRSAFGLPGALPRGRHSARAGILHALAYVLAHAGEFAPGSRVAGEPSGRGDKDMDIVEKALNL